MPILNQSFCETILVDGITLSSGPFHMTATGAQQAAQQCRRDANQQDALQRMRLESAVPSNATIAAEMGEAVIAC